MEYLDVKDGLLTQSPFDWNGFNEPHGTLSKKNYHQITETIDIVEFYKYYRLYYKT
ncbi:hypothetical protein ABIE66_001135 [Peribacillus sp. B2I2]